MDAVDTTQKLHLAGQLNNSGIKVYVDPLLQKNTVMVGYKAKQINNSGYIYAPYFPMGGMADPYWGLYEREDFEFK